MSTMPHTNRHRACSAARRRQGSAYVFVLGVCVLTAVAGMALVTSTQIRARITAPANDMTEAAVLAESAIEHAVNTLATNPNWRTAYSSGVETAAIPMGRGTISFKLVDETDGNLANDPSQPVRAYGIGRIGTTTRIYSVQLIPNGPPLDLLKTVCHAGANASASATISSIGGPFSANGVFTINSASTVNGSVEAPTVVNAGGIVNGAIRTVPVKQMPSATVFDSYRARATEIPFAALNVGTIALVVLSPAANPYGGVNAKGIYYVRVPSTGTLTIRQARLVATLLVDLDPGAKFTTSNAWLMEAPSPSQPALIIRTAGGTTTVDLNGFTNPLSEASAGVNFNPPGTPYPWNGGNSNTNLTDSYPAELRGVAHIIGAGQTVNIGSNFTSRGTVIVEGTAALGSNMTMTLDQNIAQNPPVGYTASGQMLPVTGTWRWETLP